MAKPAKKCVGGSICGTKAAPGWLTTFGDLMALLLTFFVLLLSFSTVSEDDFENAIGALQGALGVLDGQPILTSPVKLHVPIVRGDITEARPTMNDAKAEIEEITEEEEQQQNVEVTEGEEGIVIRIRDRAVFGSGLAEIKDEFKSLLSRIGQVINRMPNQVVIEGHTDNVPISNDAFTNNHWLSSARALQVLDYFADDVGIERTRLSASGFGEYRPVDPEADQNAPAVRAQNRRVEIRILYNKEAEEAEPDSVKTLIGEFGLGVDE